MCLVLFAWKAVPGHRLILASNRDEFYWRPTEPVHRWSASPVVAGRDSRSGGTWLGVTSGGRIGLVTNIRNGLPGRARHIGGTAPDRSRGLLVRDFLESDLDPGVFCEELGEVGDRYEPFNLIVGDDNELYWVTNWRGFRSVTLDPGIYGLSNAELDSGWPKVQDGRSRFSDLLMQERLSRLERTEGLFGILADRRSSAEDRLPDTHVPRWVERGVAPAFVRVGVYGTRASTIVEIAEGGAPLVEERRFGWFGRPRGDQITVHTGDSPALPGR